MTFLKKEDNWLFLVKLKIKKNRETPLQVSWTARLIYRIAFYDVRLFLSWSGRELFKNPNYDLSLPPWLSLSLSLSLTITSLSVFLFPLSLFLLFYLPLFLSFLSLSFTFFSQSPLFSVSSFSLSLFFLSLKHTHTHTHILWLSVCLPLYLFFSLPLCKRGNLRGVMAKVLNYGLEVSRFELLSRYYVHFRTNTREKGLEPSHPPSYELNSITAVLQQRWLWH